MKAAQISEYGDASVVQIVDVNKPQPTGGQVLVAVRASSLNPFDTSVRQGSAKHMLRLPVTLGGDIAGVIVSLGEGVTNFQIGEKIYGQALAVAGNSGAFAEFAATAASQIARAPQNISDTEAACLPLAGISALQALTEHIRLQAGQKLFIHGGAGGIGTIAIQIARNIGAYVAVTATGERIDLVKQLGADEIVDYTREDFSSALHEYDAVFDTVGGEDFTKSLGILKRGGIAVSMIAHADEAIANERAIRVLTQMTRVTTARLDALRALVDEGKVKPIISKVFPLDQIQAAFREREMGHFSGKVVVAIGG